MKTREEFVEICTCCVKKTREELAIRNQVSGYLKYHKEIKENNFFSNLRSVSEKNEKEFGYSLSDEYKLIKKAKMGNCYELAEYLSVKIIKQLKKENINAEVRIVSSKKVDHVFLHVSILLKGEKNKSLWEIDAWDPRIIDISTRPDGTIKNQESLDYGISHKLRHRTKTQEFKKRKISNSSFMAIREPIEGKPLRDATPEREVLKKHKKMYSDYLLENAYENKKLDEYGEIHSLQRKSKWQ
jgi:hypothetical protein